MSIKWSNRRAEKPASAISPQRTPYGIALLLELNRSGRHIYEGTVGATEKARRRASNRRARAARRINRGRR